MKRSLVTILLTFLLCFLLFFPAPALDAARNGLLLWYRSLVPVLLPFMILSNLMIRTDCIQLFLKLLHPLIHLFFGTSIYGSYAILAGFLFGCPMGAKTVHDLYRDGRIREEEARFLIGFVNNLSPAFLITYVVRENLRAPALQGPTLAILYGAPLLAGLSSSVFYRRAALRAGSRFDSAQKNKASKVPFGPELIDACISDGITNITKLGVYLLLFSLLTEAMRLLPIKNELLRCLVSGCMEVTAGVHTVCSAALPFSQKYFCLIILCSFGGICALMQTLSVFPMRGKLLRHYLKSRCVLVLLSLLLTAVFFAH